MSMPSGGLSAARRLAAGVLGGGLAAAARGGASRPLRTGAVAGLPAGGAGASLLPALALGRCAARALPAAVLAVGLPALLAALRFDAVAAALAGLQLRDLVERDVGL